MIVRPAGTGTITITSDIPPAIPSDTFSGDLSLKGKGTLKVVLDGNVRVVNGADRTLVDLSLGSPFTGTGTIKVIGTANVNAYRTSGVYVVHNVEEDGEIGIDVGEGVRVGTVDKPSGLYGVFAYFKDGDGDIRITNRGEVYGHFKGIQAYHAGSGDVVIDTAKGSVTSQGIFARGSEKSNITIRNQGRIELKQLPRYRTGDRAVDDPTRYTYAPIEVEYIGSLAGTDENPSGSITVVSSGDLEANTANWERYSVYNEPMNADGIRITSKDGDKNSVVPITVDVMGGVITPGERDDSHGIKIHSEHRGGLVKVDFASAITRTGPTGDGIHVYRYFVESGTDSNIKESDIEVTLKPGARIGVDGEGDEPTVKQHGLRLEQLAKGGKIEATFEEGAGIGTEGTPVGGDGVWSRITDRVHKGDLRITNRGLIHAKGSGVYAWHQGLGDVVVKHEMGKIVAGGAVSAFGKAGNGDVSFLTDKGAGILAFHGGATEQNAGADAGEVRVLSKADIESEDDGILAYVKKLEQALASIVPITVEVSGGRITAKGHGVHAETATPYTDATQAGKITVTVGEKAAIMAEKDGVYVAGMRVFASDHARAGEHDQTVTIHGKVTGGGGEHAGVRMVKGGTLVIGPRAEIGAESGVAVKADGKLTITMMKDEKDRIAWIPDKFVNTADMTTFEGVSEDETVVAVSDVKTRGVYEGGMERRVTLEKTTADSLDTYQFTQESAREFREYHDRARVYEALPSVLLDLNRQTSAHARLSAARDGNGGWARVWFGDGEREADRSTTEGGEKGVGLAWDFERWGAEMGFDVPTSTEGLLLGVSAHYRDGEADVEHGGRIDASGFGFGVSATYRAEEGLYVDGQVSYTRFDDIDLSSDARGRLASGLDADGYAVGLEVGRRMEMAERNVVLTPRGGLVWSSVDVDGFDDVADVPGSGRVSFGSEDSFQGRIGVLAESADGRAYASLDVEHEFSEDRDVTASGTRLDSETEATWARLGLGFRVELDETGEAVLSGQGFYALADGDNRDYGASVALRARF